MDAIFVSRFRKPYRAEEKKTFAGNERSNEQIRMR